MAVNKRKILESAQKHLQKGALDKALEDYQTLLKADPKDSNVRLKVGDLQLKLGRAQDALDCYMRVAQQFTSEGFDAKAVALYKQVSKLDEKRFEVHAQLGELYHRMGLSSEAMKALQVAADGAYRAGDKPQALGLLRKMASLDPTNTTSRQKVADLLWQEGRPDEAISEYEEVQKELERQRNSEDQLRVLERMLELVPERPETLRTLSRVATESGAFARGESAARRILATNADDIEALQLLGGALEAGGRASEAADVFRGVAERYRTRGDEDRARELMQRYGGASEIAIDDSAPAVIAEASGDELELEPGESSALSLDEPAETDGGDTDWVEPAPQDSRESREPEGEADLEQLLAEASVLLRYGKHDRAVETLRAVLRVAPGNPNALEKLGEALLAGGNRAHAASALQRAAEGFTTAADPDGFARVRELLAKADPKAATALAPPSAPATQEESDTQDDLPGEIDIDLDLDPGEPASSAATDAPQSRGADFSGVDIDSGDISFDDAPSEKLEKAAPAGPSEVVDDPAAFSFREDDTDPTPIEVPVAGDVSARSVEGDLEEAEFYRAQGLHAEARELYERVLAAVPSHPKAMLGLGELDAPSPLPAPAAPSAQQSAALPSGEIEVAKDSRPGAAPEVRPAARGVPLPAAPLAPVAPPPPPASAPAPLQAKPPLRQADETIPALPPFEDPAPPELGAGDFDLAAELTGAIGDAAPAAGVDGTEAEGFREVFAAFKAGVAREVGDGDFEAHYDLGIAYKEMGLLNDAIAEFRAALGGAARRVACLHLMGLCAIELGRGGDAVAHISQALAGGTFPPQQEAALRADLGRAYAAVGDRVRARAAYEAARALDSGLPDIEARIAELDAPLLEEAPAAASEPEEGLESFDDLLEESAAEAPASAEAPPVYESFEDFASDEDDEAASPSTPLLEEEAEPAASPPAPARGPEPAKAAPLPVARPAPTPPRAEAPAASAPSVAPAPAPARRKKKISFV